MRHHRFSRSSLQHRRGVDPRLIRISDRALELTRIDFGIPEYGGLRSAEEQQKLFSDGLSQCDGIEIPSYHQTGRALDFYAYVAGEASWAKEHLAQVAAAFLQAAAELGIPLQWGGLWTSFVDMPHVQLAE